MNKGKVWLIGAGPYDDGLITVKGKSLIEKADVVVYDRLIGQNLILSIPENAKKIDVGKQAGNHKLKQCDINKILLEEALSGKKVVRLKGGDPFLFGRGAEELELLIENEIEFEIVPGISSALAIPAYNGIPVTHRNFSSSLHIVTAHFKDSCEKSIDFKSLVNLKGTIVFLMGVNSIKYICDGLIEAGIDLNTPSAVLEKGSSSKQRCIYSEISNLYQESQNKNAKSPAIVIVGEVCRFYNKFNWYDKMPLSKTKILVTRPKENISETAQKLKSLGAEVLELPLIKIKEIYNSDIENCLNNIEKYNWILFTSVIGVRIFFDKLKNFKKDIRNLKGIKIGVIGEKTKKAVEDKGILADVIPGIFSAENLGKMIYESGLQNEKILIPRAENGSKDLISALEKDKFIIDDLPIYQTNYLDNDLINLKDEFVNNNIDFVMFTSASTVKGFANIIKDINYSCINALCIGKQTKIEADKYNMNTFVSNESTIESLIDLIFEIKGVSKNDC